MKRIGICLFVAVITLCCAFPSYAQQSAGTVPNIVVPPLVKFSGSLADGAGHPLTTTTGVTFSLYKDAQGGAALWMETQNVTPNSTGHYTALLGSTKSTGVPVDLFASGDARWLGVQVAGQAEQPRVLMVSVPYALKALDAETIGGKPASAFMPMPAPTQASSSSAPVTVTTSSASLAAPASASKTGTPPPADVTGTGKPGDLAIWKTSSSLTSSLLSETAAANSVFLTTSSDTQAFSVMQTGTGNGVESETSGTGSAVFGNSTATSGTINAVVGQIVSTNGAGIYGTAAGTTGGASGVEGISASGSGTGVMGINTNTSGNAFAVSGTTSSSGGVGVFGVGVQTSKEGAGLGFRPIGVWGDSGSTASIAAGVLASADGNNALIARNNAGNVATADLENDEDTDFQGPVLVTYGSHYDGTCFMDVEGDLDCTGSKSAVVPVDAGARHVALYAVESPENWFEDFGSGQLAGGIATIKLEPTFAQTINADMEYHVFLTPRGDCDGLYVTNLTATGFEVRELHRGSSSVAFDYRIVARRKGYEAIRMQDKTKVLENIHASRLRANTLHEQSTHRTQAASASIAGTSLRPEAALTNPK